MDIDDLIGKLEGVKRQPRGYLARCPGPAHGRGDVKPSLSVSLGNDGRILLHCFTFDSTDDVLAALGLTWADLFPEKIAEDRRPVAEYEYRAEDGQLLYVVERRVGKRFAQRSPQPDGSWKWNLNGTRRVLYHLPRVAAAVKAGKHIFLVEGEKDVHTVEKLGFVATTNSGGVDGWRDDLTKSLVGAKVVVLYDNDDAGHKRATHLTSVLRGRVRSLKVVDLPGLPDKGDVTDWVAAGGTREQLIALVKKTREAGLPGSKFLRKLAEIEGTGVDWLWRPRIPRGEVTVLAGHPGIGKSYVSMSIAATLSVGGTFPDRDDHVIPAATVYIPYEDDPGRVLKPRFETMGGNSDLLYIPEPETPEGRRRVFRANDIPLLVAAIREHPEVGLVVIDPVISLFVGGGNPNREDEVRAVLEPLALVAHEYDLAVLLITHLNKSETASNLIQRMLGAMGFAGLARSILLCGTHPEDPTRKILAHIKCNVARLADPIEFHLDDRGVGWGGEVNVSAADLVRGAKARQSLVVDEWLLGYLADMHEHPHSEIAAAADAVGFSARQLRRSRERLDGQVSNRRVEGIGDAGYWVWWRFQ